MEIQQVKKHTYEEFLKITKDIERIEFIDGYIYYMSSPSVEHQRISLKLSNKLFNFFESNKCEVFTAPLDIILQKKGSNCIRSVQPDIMVICDKNKPIGNNYKGVPILIIEILSPSNASNDTITKLDLYQKFKVPEYWIVSPKNKSVLIYTYDEELNAYGEPLICSKDDIIKSSIFNDLSISLDVIF